MSTDFSSKFKKNAFQNFSPISNYNFFLPQLSPFKKIIVKISFLKNQLFYPRHPTPKLAPCPTKKRSNFKIFVILLHHIPSTLRLYFLEEKKSIFNPIIGPSPPHTHIEEILIFFKNNLNSNLKVRSLVGCGGSWFITCDQNFDLKVGS